MGLLPELPVGAREHVAKYDDGTAITFQLRLIPGRVWQAIQDLGETRASERGETDGPTNDDVAPEILAAGIEQVYTSKNSTPVTWSASVAELTNTTPRTWGTLGVDGERSALDAAREVWETWPDRLRIPLYRAVIAYTRVGAGDPFDGSPSSGSGGPQTPDASG